MTTVGRQHRRLLANGASLPRFNARRSVDLHLVHGLFTSLARQTQTDVDEKFARDSLQIRLAGAEPELVQAVLALGKDLCKFLEQGVVLGTLRHLLFYPTEQSKK
ncbi:uncharacterized protein LOC144116169 [Amblyomma americanum]